MNLELWENLVTSDTFIESIPLVRSKGRTGILRWRHSIRGIGGNWEGEGEYEGASTERERFFLENLGRRLKVVNGGVTYWEGQIVSMELTEDNQTWIRSMEKNANWLSVIYSKVGDNIFQNGDVEGSPAWDDVGSPTSHYTNTVWWARGTTSMFVASDAANEGTRVDGGAVAIQASIAYSCSVIINVVAGTWTLQVLDNATQTLIASRVTDGTAGRTTLTCQIPDTNEYTSVDVKVICSATGAQAYMDGAMLRTSPVKSQTKWWTDTDAATAYGRIEEILLEREMTDDEADGIAQKELSQRAWPRTNPPRRGQTFLPDDIRDRDGLIINCLGMVWTLAWRHALTEGTDQADNHINALLDESEFVTSANAVVDTNTAEVFLDSRNPTTLWDQIQKCIETGNGSGTPWVGGVYAGREFRFESRPTETYYEFHRGNLQNLGGGERPNIEFIPGWCRMTDMPMQPASAASDADEDDPKRIWLEEIWLVYDRGEERVKWTREWED